MSKRGCLLSVHRTADLHGGLLVLTLLWLWEFSGGGGGREFWPWKPQTAATLYTGAQVNEATPRAKTCLAALSKTHRQSSGPEGVNRCSSRKRWPCSHLALSFAIASLQRLHRTAHSVGYLSHSWNASTSLPTQESKFCKRLKELCYFRFSFES